MPAASTTGEATANSDELRSSLNTIGPHRNSEYTSNIPSTEDASDGSETEAEIVLPACQGQSPARKRKVPPSQAAEIPISEAADSVLPARQKRVKAMRDSGLTKRNTSSETSLTNADIATATAEAVQPRCEEAHAPSMPEPIDDGEQELERVTFYSLGPGQKRKLQIDSKITVSTLARVSRKTLN